MRYLAIDLGDKRSGLAVGDGETGVVSPIGLLELPPGPELVTAILKRVEDHEPEGIVLGLPLNMDGSEGPRARRAREFGALLGRHTDRPIHYHDERLTSFAADQQMARSGRTHKQKKKRRDAIAAAEILRGFLALSAG